MVIFGGCISKFRSEILIFWKVVEINVSGSTLHCYFQPVDCTISPILSAVGVSYKFTQDELSTTWQNSGRSMQLNVELMGAANGVPGPHSGANGATS